MAGSLAGAFTQFSTYDLGSKQRPKTKQRPSRGGLSVLNGEIHLQQSPHPSRPAKRFIASGARLIVIDISRADEKLNHLPETAGLNAIGAVKAASAVADISTPASASLANVELSKSVHDHPPHPEQSRGHNLCSQLCATMTTTNENVCVLKGVGQRALQTQQESVSIVNCVIRAVKHTFELCY